MTAPEPELIELGELASDAPEPSSRTWRPRVTATQRRLLAVLILAAVALIPRGSALASTSPLGDPLWTMKVGFTPQLTPDLVVVRDGKGGFSALDRNTGRLRFRFLSGSMGMVTQWRSAGPLAVAMQGELDGDQLQVAMVDPVSGRTISVAPGSVVGATRGGDVFLLDASVPADCPVGAPPRPGNRIVSVECEQISAIDGHTGARLWQRLVAPGDLAQYDYDAVTGLISTVSIVDSRGGFALYDAATGAELWHGTIPTAIEEALNSVGGAVVVTPDRIVYAYPEGDVVRVTSYARGKATAEWSELLDGAAPVSGITCERFLCFYGDQGTLLLDQRTGAPALDRPDGQLEFLGFDTVAETSLVDQQETTTLFDLRTGRATSRLPIEQYLSWPEGGGRILGLRRVGKAQTLYLSWADGRSEALGRIPGSTPDPDSAQCSADGDVLACLDLSGMLRVWRLPS